MDLLPSQLASGKGYRRGGGIDALQRHYCTRRITRGVRQRGGVLEITCHVEGTFSVLRPLSLRLSVDFLRTCFQSSRREEGYPQQDLTLALSAPQPAATGPGDSGCTIS